MAEKSGFSAEEKAAMKERAKETRAKRSKKDGAAELAAKIGEMSASDRKLAKRIHKIIVENAPDLEPTTWYGMPAYARGGKTVLFFQAGEKFGSRYATLGFSDSAQLDSGSMWATSFAVVDIGPAEEKKITALLKKAARAPR